MYYIISYETCPYKNQAYELYLLENYNQDYFLLYINDISISVGRNQIIEREINKDFILNNKIPIVRRISGGGTVTHDLGNINFSFIGNRVNFNNSSVWIQNNLKKHCNISLKFKLNGLYIDRFKVSGSAQYFKNKRYISHSTLLVESDIDIINESIKNDKYDHYISRAQRSNKVPITNLRSFNKNVSCKQIFKIIDNIYHLKNINEFVDPHSELLLNFMDYYKSSKWIGKEPFYYLQESNDVNNYEVKS